MTEQWRIQDFQTGVIGANPKCRGTNLLFEHFFPKLHERGF